MSTNARPFAAGPSLRGSASTPIPPSGQWSFQPTTKRGGPPPPGPGYVPPGMYAPEEHYDVGNEEMYGYDYGGFDPSQGYGSGPGSPYMQDPSGPMRDMSLSKGATGAAPFFPSGGAVRPVAGRPPPGPSKVPSLFGIAPSGPPPQAQGAPYFEPMQHQHSPQQPMYYPQHDPTLPLQYHLYAGPLPHVAHDSNMKPVSHFFMADHIRETLQRRAEATLLVPDPASAEAMALPSEVNTYHSLTPLELDKVSEKFSKVFRMPVHTYKAVNATDGLTYCLRRVEGFRLTNQMALGAVDTWRRIGNASTVALREAFTTKAFNDNSLVFVYDYFPLSETLLKKLFASGAPMLSEATLWSYIIQIASGVRAVHVAGRACRTLDHSKILVTGKNRLRLNCLGMADVLAFDGGKNTAAFQQDDLIAFGNLVVTLACNSLAAVQNINKAVDIIGRQFSPDLKNFVLYLLSKPSASKNMEEVSSILGPRVMHELGGAYRYADELEGELSKETENGRLVRLLCKLGFVNERPEFDMDPSWSETGDRYLLKLFRDYVFHQVDEQGDPIVDLAHVIVSLNKLDAGLNENVRLMSRDEQSCLVVSFKDLKACAEAAFRELTRHKRPHASQQGQQ